MCIAFTQIVIAMLLKEEKNYLTCVRTKRIKINTHKHEHIADLIMGQKKPAAGTVKDWPLQLAGSRQHCPKAKDKNTTKGRGGWAYKIIT